jgi:pilus assembly protein CpaB
VGVNSRRTIILIAAILVGAIAAYALFTYVGGIEDKANGNAQRVTIYKISRDIPKGFFGDEAFKQGYIKKDQIAKEFRPATAITDPKQIDGLVAISNLPANSVVVSDQFVSQQSSLSTFSQLLKNNQVAITITVDQVRGVAGLLVPGDFVNILITNSSAGETVAPPTAAAAAAALTSGGSLTGSPSAKYLYQKVQILAIGQTKKLEPGEVAPAAGDGTTASGQSGLITFAVPAVAAQYIASVTPDSIYLTLVAKDYQPVPLTPLDPNAPIPALDPNQLTPYGPKGQTE